MNPNAHRRFVFEALNSGLALEMIKAEDVLEFVTPEVLAHHLPVALKARLLQASLSAARMTPGLVVEVIGVEALVEHSPLPVLWACVRACAARQLQSQAGDSLGASLGIGSGTVGVPNGAAAPAGLNGSSVTQEDLHLKPAKTARPVGIRPGSSPPRISTLSPRSHVLRRGAEPGPGQPTNGAFDVARGADDSPDFEIIEESEMPTRLRPVSRPLAEDDTRPGTKT